MRPLPAAIRVPWGYYCDRASVRGFVISSGAVSPGMCFVRILNAPLRPTNIDLGETTVRLAAILALVAAAAGPLLTSAAPRALAADVLTFQVDPGWPKPLPNDWIMGQAAGVAVDAQDNIWVVQRPKTLTDDEKAASFDPPRTKCCKPAPPVLVFNQAGDLIKSWGGPGQGYDWPQNEHGIFVDHKGFVWLAGNGENDGQILKFTADGKFILQIGKQGRQTNSQDTSRLGKPAQVTVDPETNEVYVADGYYNHRIIVFDVETGALKRMWGAYGKPPTDENLGPYDPAAAPRSSFATRSIASRSRVTGSFMCATARTTASRCSARTALS